MVARALFEAATRLKQGFVGKGTNGEYQDGDDMAAYSPVRRNF